MTLEWMIIFCAAAGFAIAAYIYFHKKKKAKGPLVCPIGHSCDPVIHSKYSTTLGFENTLLGMFYYAGIAGMYKLELFEISFPEQLMTLAFLATLGAFLFSLYLLYIQAFKLKNWCSWCIASAILTTAILVLSYLRL